jgi:hypothetical protein
VRITVRKFSDKVSGASKARVTGGGKQRTYPWPLESREPFLDSAKNFAVEVLEINPSLVEQIRYGRLTQVFAY